MLLVRELKITFVLLLVMLAAGCAGTLGARISEEDRDTTGTYDGIWTVEVQKAAGIQYYGKWQIRCGNMQNSFNVLVRDGAMVLSDAKDAKKGFVSAEGKFKITVPLEGDVQASVNSGTRISAGDRQLTLAGKLVPSSEKSGEKGGEKSSKKSAGYITYGIAEMGYSGCTAKTIYKFDKQANKSTQS